MTDSAKESRLDPGRLGVGLVVVMLLGFSLWWWWQSGRDAKREGEWNEGRRVVEVDRVPIKDETVPRPVLSDVEQVLSELPPSPLDAYVKGGAGRRERLWILGHVLSEYHTAMGEIPAGLPSEIFAALKGKNRRGIRYVPEGHPALGSRGVPVNPEGHEIIPHVISASQGVFELRDPGPDGMPYSDDDLLLAFPVHPPVDEEDARVPHSALLAVPRD